MKRILIVPILCMCILEPLYGQDNGEIEFSRYADYSMTLDIGLGDLGFGPVVRGSNEAPHIYELDLHDALPIDVIAVPYLDIQVDIIVENDGYLLLESADNTQYIGDPQRSIPFMLESAFSNAGAENHSPGHAQLITVSNNIASTRFPVLQRQFQPPGPPPTPPSGESAEEFPEETALLWLYGYIEVGDVDAGDYMGRIRIDITYE